MTQQYIHLILLLLCSSLGMTSLLANPADNSLSVSYWPQGGADLSTGVVLGQHWILADDEAPNRLLVYSKQHVTEPVTRLLLTEKALRTGAGKHCLGIKKAKCDGESDLEASVRLGEQIIWIGSHSNNSKGKLRPDRWRIIATQIQQQGDDFKLQVQGYYQHLRDDLIQWDKSAVHGLGKHYFGLHDSMQKGVSPESKRKDGFSIEALSLAPDQQTGWIGLRAPLVSAPGEQAVQAGSAERRSHALLLPVTNFAELVATTGGGQAGSARFGQAIRLDLGGRGIREIRRNAQGQYLILAGPAASKGKAPNDFRLFAWNGQTDAQGEAINVQLLKADLTAMLDGMDASPEGLLEPQGDLLAAQSTVYVISDSGDVDFDGSGRAAKELPLSQRKGRINLIQLGGVE